MRRPGSRPAAETQERPHASSASTKMPPVIFGQQFAFVRKRTKKRICSRIASRTLQKRGRRIPNWVCRWTRETLAVDKYGRLIGEGFLRRRSIQAAGAES